MIGFLKRLLQGEGEKAKPVQWPLEQAWQAAKAEEENARQETETFVGPKFSQVKFLLKEARRLALEIKGRELEKEEGHKKFRKIVQSTKDNFARHILKLTEQFEPPSGQDKEAVKRYCLESGVRLEKDIAGLWKSIAIANTLLKKELKELSECLEELNNHFIELKGFAEKKLVAQEESLALLKRLKEKEEASQAAGARLEKLEREVKALQEREEERVESLEKVKESEEYRELEAMGEEEKALGEERSAFSQEVVQLLSPVAKPLSRMAKMAAAEKLFLDRHEEELLNLYLEKPLEAVKLDPKAEALKRLLRELEKGLEDETIGLKEKEKDKRLDAVKGLLEKNAFERFWQLNRLKVKENELAKRKGESQAGQKLEEAERRLDAVRAELEEKGLEKEELKARQDKLEGERAGLVGQAEESLEKMMGREVKLV